MTHTHSTALKPTGLIAYQGEPGSNSDAACRQMFPTLTPHSCTTFEQAFNAVQSGVADAAMIPVENSIAGRVRHPPPTTGLGAIRGGEYFLPIHFQLLACKHHHR